MWQLYRWAEAFHNRHWQSTFYHFNCSCFRISGFSQFSYDSCLIIRIECVCNLSSIYDGYSRNKIHLHTTAGHKINILTFVTFALYIVYKVTNFNIIFIKTMKKKHIKIDILNMGIQKEDREKMVSELKNIDQPTISIKTFDLFSLTDLVKVRIRILEKKSDIIILYWDINERPVKWLLNLSFPVFGLLGMQYHLVSSSKVPILIISKDKMSSFLHADLVAYAKSKGRNAYLAEDVKEIKTRIKVISDPPFLGNKKICIFGTPFKSSTIRGKNLTTEFNPY